MPLPGYGNITSSAGSVGGAAYTRLRGPALVGQLQDNAGGSIFPAPGGLIMVHSTASPLSKPGVISTAAAVIGRAPFIYILQTTNPIATSSFASGDSAPAYSDCGAAPMWDAGRAKFGIYSTASGSGVWMWSAAFTSS